MKKISLVALLALIVCSAVAFGVKAIAVNEVDSILRGSVTRDGKVISLAKNISLMPNEIVTWQHVLKNNRNSAIQNINIDEPIIPGVLMDSSAQAGSAAVSFSLDGQSYSSQPVIFQDGKRVPAPSSQYKFIRFSYPRVEAGQEVVASFQVVVR